MQSQNPFWNEHQALTRRYFLKLGLAGAALSNVLVSSARGAEGSSEMAGRAARFQEYFTPQEKFQDVSRGTPLPHSLPLEEKSKVGLTRETWKLEVVSDPQRPVKLRQSMTKSDRTAFDFPDLMKLAEKQAVRFAKAMTCLNIGCPLGVGIWEGVPLRELIWLTDPREELRRVFYYGYHNDKPEQMFKSSLPIGRVLEDPFGLPPVILCYKLNGEWLSPERGGPVRIVVPEDYGFKSIKWLSHMVLTNLPHANDTYADQGNDVNSPMKTFAATLTVPAKIQAGQPIPLSGYAQVGIGGLKKVQIWIQKEGEKLPEKERYFASAPWTDVEILPPPQRWGGKLADDKIPLPTHGFDTQTGKPLSWPMKLTLAHWAGMHPGLPAGKYTLRSRTIDEQGHAQPLPRPFRKSGHAAIEEVSLTVEWSTITKKDFDRGEIHFIHE